MSPPAHLFASDNSSGVHPNVMQALTQANQAHTMGYGADHFTQLAEQAFAEVFGATSQAFLLTTGTACNVLALQAITQSIDTVFCADIAHLFVDECSAPERMIGCKLIGVPSKHGKIDLQALQRAYEFQQDPHHRNRAKVLSISQGTEYGTIYSLQELQDLSRFARSHGLKLHMDGARLANAAAALDLGLADISRAVGVDVLSFGGTKNGLMMAEAVVVFDPELAQSMHPIRKQGMQLISKHRFLAAQYIAYFAHDLWLHNARHANSMAARLASHFEGIQGVKLTAPTAINMVFAEFPAAWIEPIQQHCGSHLWLPGGTELRFVCSFDTSTDAVDSLAQLVRELAANA